jgi:hypothetical protein
MNKLLVKVLVLGCAMLLSACGSTPTKSISCHSPTSKRLNDAVLQSQNTLSQSACAGYVDSHFDALLTIAEGAPGQTNNATLRDYLQWLVDQGLMYEKEAKTRYNSYFNPRYVSLPETQSVCNTERSLDDLVLNMDRETKKKERGLQRVLGDNAAYFRAIRNRDNTLLLMSAAIQACGA